jgi:hypothetical protein
MQMDMHDYSTRSSFNYDMFLHVPNTHSLKKHCMAIKIVLDRHVFYTLGMADISAHSQSVSIRLGVQSGHATTTLTITTNSLYDTNFWGPNGFLFEMTHYNDMFELRQ